MVQAAHRTRNVQPVSLDDPLRVHAAAKLPTWLVSASEGAALRCGGCAAPTGLPARSEVRRATGGSLFILSRRAAVHVHPYVHHTRPSLAALSNREGVREQNRPTPECCLRKRFPRSSAGNRAGGVENVRPTCLSGYLNCLVVCYSF